MSDYDEMTKEDIQEFFNSINQKLIVNKLAGKMANTHVNGPFEPVKPEMTEYQKQAEKVKEDFIENAEQAHIRSMSIEQANSFIEMEKDSNNQNDIYKISARVKNLARTSGAKLTDQGTSMCNLYTHVLKSLYLFSNKIQDSALKSEYIELVRSHENLPGNIIVALRPSMPKEEVHKKRKKTRKKKNE